MPRSPQAFADAVRDISAADVAAAGLDHLARALPTADDRSGRYRNAALVNLDLLVTDDATAGTASNGLLTEGAYDRGKGDFGESTVWGDYFSVEGLVRATRTWAPYR